MLANKRNSQTCLKSEVDPDVQEENEFKSEVNKII